MPSQFNNLLYILQHKTHRGAVWVHVDDGVVTGSNEGILGQLESDLKDCLEIKWQEGVETIVVGVKRTQNGFTLYQTNLIDKILGNHWDGSSMAKAPLPSGYQAATDNIADGDPNTSTDFLYP